MLDWTTELVLCIKILIFFFFMCYCHPLSWFSPEWLFMHPEACCKKCVGAHECFTVLFSFQLFSNHSQRLLPELPEVITNKNFPLTQNLFN